MRLQTNTTISSRSEILETSVYVQDIARYTLSDLVCLDTLQPFLRALVSDDDERPSELVERYGRCLTHTLSPAPSIENGCKTSSFTRGGARDRNLFPYAIN